jgi:hypothetical protein
LRALWLSTLGVSTFAVEEMPLTVIPNEAGWSWGSVGEGSARVSRSPEAAEGDLTGLASTLSIKSRLRSDHWGLTLRIRAIFFERRQPWSSFSEHQAKPGKEEGMT